MTEITARFERIKSRPAYELVAEAIERKILAGRLKPGDPVGTESELVKQFGVNRSTVREGIRLLEQSGLVAREPSRRLSVAVPHYHRLATRMTPRAHPAAGDVPRAVAYLARAGARRRRSGHGQRTEEDLAELAANVAKTRKLQHDPAAVAELDAEFHRLIGKAAHNRVLLLAKEPSGMLVRPTTALIIFNNPRRHPAPDRGAHAHPRRAAAARPREGPPVGRPAPARLEGRLRARRLRPRQPGRPHRPAHARLALRVGQRAISIPGLVGGMITCRSP